MLYNSDGVNVVMHGGSIYVTGQQGSGMWSMLKPLGKFAKPIIGQAKNMGMQLYNDNKDQVIDAGKTAIAAKKKSMGLGVETYNMLSPGQREAIANTKRKHTVSASQKEALARGRATAAANRAAKKLTA